MTMAQRIEPGPGQESVWNYPRPPRLVACSRSIEVIFNGIQIVQTQRSMRVLETSHPPVYYIPPEDIAMHYFTQTSRSSFCEWKGLAGYYSLSVAGSGGDPAPRQVENVAWFYPNPTPAFEPIRNYLALYAGPMDCCRVDGETVQPQPGNFYGGWINSWIVGPFKQGPGQYI
ncbi:MAG: DUF427 domain-containing protein [Synechococcales cyanobacterium RM1_1_8]|nr:DUF427 domain-containing protein [Synechococcales cyanobacterium RM1_1_8]